MSSHLKKNTIISTGFDKYTLIEQKGSGGNGVVYSSSNSSSEIVAIKFINLKEKSSRDLKRLRNEIHFSENCNHKNLIKIIDRGYVSFEEKDTKIEYIFYVMPLYDCTLRNKINNGLVPDEIIKIFCGVLEGLNFAHKNGVIHRDLKPENILFKNDSNDPVICDFGIAHFSEKDLITTIKTEKNERLANFRYASPEQKDGSNQITFLSDIYSVALMLNEMFTKKVPQAPGYEKISDVNSEFAYLDDLFSLMYQQNPKDRLYPIDKILTTLNVYEKTHDNLIAIETINNSITEISKQEDYKISIIRKDYKDEKIIFIVDKNIEHEWFEVLKSGRYSHTYSSQYATYQLVLLNNKSFAMPIRIGANTETIKNTVQNIFDWVAKANIEFASNRERERLELQRKNEEKRQEEIRRKAYENEILKIINE